MNIFHRAYIAFKSRAEAVGSRARIEGPISKKVLNDVTDSIKNRWQMSIMYVPEDGGLKRAVPSKYAIMPLTYGISKFTKNHLLRAYTFSGGSFIGFETFRLDRMRSTTPLKSTKFSKPPGFKIGADELMSEIFLQAKFK